MPTNITCPCCDQPLTERQIKALWGAYCASRVPAEKKGGGAKPWKAHSEKAGLKCRCAACHKLRQMKIELFKPVEAEPPSPEDLTWDAVMTVNPEDGYEALVRYEAAKLRAKQRNKARKDIASARYKRKIELLLQRAHKEKVYGKVLNEARKRVEEEVA